MQPSAYSATPARARRSRSRDQRAAPRSRSATIGQSAENANGSVPPSGNATASASTGRAPRRSPTVDARQRRPDARRSSRYAPTACAAPASAANSAATGLASAVTNASATASPGAPALERERRRRPPAAARTRTSVGPVNRLVPVATPNHSAPSHASSPKRRWASDSNSAALPDAAIAAGELRRQQRAAAAGTARCNRARCGPRTTSCSRSRSPRWRTASRGAGAPRGRRCAAR